MSMAKQGAKTAVPRLRFPEFRKTNSWQDGTMLDYAKVVAGQSPDGAYYNEIGDGLPFYQGKSDFGEIFLEKPRKWTSQVTKRADAGDIVMSVRAPVGALNVTTEEVCIGRGLAAIQAKGSKWFLYYLLDSISSSIVGNGGSVFDSIN
jgi:type I restriction enzyme S subunit